MLYISGRHEDNPHVSEGLRQSGRFFLKKPFTKKAFLETVTKALEHPPPRPTDGFAFLLGYPAITARVMPQWELATGPTRDLRYQLELPVRAHLADKTESIAGVTTNVSRTGIRIVTDEPVGPIAEGTDVSLRLELPSSGVRSAALTAVGQVTRIEPPVSDTGGSAVSVAVRHYHPDVRR